MPRGISTTYTQGPGLSHEAAVFLASKEIAVVGLDNPFTDAALNQPGVGPFPPIESWENGSNAFLTRFHRNDSPPIPSVWRR
jgi:hypothetical protein